MPRRRQTKKGKLNPMDVRSKGDVSAFESLLGRGPLTIVLVYADWCGHCQTFKQNMWNEVSAMPKKNLNTASVHYDMVNNTSLKNAKIDGYPSLLLVGTDKKPASFKEESGETNAMPSPQSLEELKNMVNTPVSTPVVNANSIATTVINNAKTPVNSMINNNLNSGMTVNEDIASTTKNNLFAKNVNSYEPADPTSLTVPDSTNDIPRESALLQSEVQNNRLNGQRGGQRGGSETLLAALTKITAEAGHAGALLLAATEYADLGKRMTRRFKKRSKKTLKRKQRR
jgi:thiol-disulfide isomerase/thioredoxin